MDTDETQTEKQGPAQAPAKIFPHSGTTQPRVTIPKTQCLIAQCRVSEQLIWASPTIPHPGLLISLAYHHLAPDTQGLIQKYVRPLFHH